MTRLFSKFLLSAVLALVFLGLNSQSLYAVEKCDRACLRGFMDGYLEALVARDPSRLPVSKDVRYTENTVEIKLGEALWWGATGLGGYKHYIIDPKTSQVGYIGVIMEHNIPVLMALRLKIRHGMVSEIESYVARNGLLASIPISPEMATREPLPIFSETLKPSERVSREEMIRIANQYFEGIEANSGDIVPFDDNCHRTENGIYTANNPNPQKDDPMSAMSAMKAKDQFNVPGSMIWDIPERKFWMVDEEKGLVIGAFVFSTDGIMTPEAEARLADGASREALAHNPLAELFKIKNGKIYDIVAVLGPFFPYGSKTGW